MRQWSVDASRDDAFSPYSPYSPPSQRTTAQSLRPLPTNIDRIPGRKPAAALSPASAFPSAPAEWNPSLCSSTESSFAFPPQPAPQYVRVLSRGFDSETRHRRNRTERDNEEEEILMGSTRSRLLPPSDVDEGWSQTDAEEEDEDLTQRGVRLSRHIPQREGVDMSVSAFNLLESDSLGAPGTGLPPFPSLPSPQAPPTTHGSAAFGATSMLLGSRGSRARATAASVSPGQSSQLPAFVNASLPTPSLSSTASFTDSHVSDDSTYMTSLYNDMLADKLVHGGSNSGTGQGISTASGVGAPSSLGTAVGDGRRGRASDGSSSSGRSSGEGGPLRARPRQQRRDGLGGEVLRFGGGGGGEAVRSASSSTTASPRGLGDSSSAFFGPRGSGTSSADRRRPPSTSTPGSVVATSLSTRGGRTGNGGAHSGGGGRHTRILHTNPERVLDAPEFPADNTMKRIDWGSNNKLIIGLKSALYAWDAETGRADKMVDLQGGLEIDCVQWLHKCACVALGVGGGTTAIYDCRSEDFIRTVRLPPGNRVTGIAVNGPVMAVSSDGSTGLTQAFDLRAKHALIASYEGHAGAVTAMQYCGAEPYYLATAGKEGHVRIWDARRSQSIRYAYDSVHSGAVTALHWNPDRRSRLFTGGEDGVLCHIDTHATARTLGESTGLADEEGASAPLLLGLGGNSNSSVMGHGGLPGSASGTHVAITRAVRSMFPISGMSVVNGEVLTSHRGQGQLQLRKASSFQLLGVFSAPNCTRSLSCLTLAPDRQVVCAAQEDETLKFWRVFDAPPREVDGAGSNSGSGLRASGHGSGARGRLGEKSLGGGLPLPLHQHSDPMCRLDEQLR